MGYLDYWSGSLSSSGLQYNADAVLNSTVASILSQINGDSLTSTLITSLRNSSTVRCDFEKDMRPCKPFSKPCLFHIVKDPCEHVNLNYKPNSEMRKFVQAKIDYFETSLDKFRESASKPMNTRGTKDANPALYNNTWINWDDHEASTWKIYLTYSHLKLKVINCHFILVIIIKNPTSIYIYIIHIHTS